MRTFILGTDWWTDCDDAAALRILCNAVKNEEINLAGIAINACMPYSAASVKAFLKNEGIEGVQIGIDREAVDFGGNPPYQKNMAENSSYDNDCALNAADLYMRILTRSSEPVELVEIGYPQVLAEILNRDYELFKNKVSHVWMMAGKWDENPGRENNFARNRRASLGAEAFCRLCPVPVTFLGWEVGASVIVGSNLEKDDMLYRAFRDHGSQNGRSAWDPMLVSLALTGNPDEAGYSCVYGKASVDPETGFNTFIPDDKGIQRYVKKLYPDDWYRERIDNLLKRR